MKKSATDVPVIPRTADGQIDAAAIIDFAAKQPPELRATYKKALFSQMTLKEKTYLHDAIPKIKQDLDKRKQVALQKQQVALDKKHEHEQKLQVALDKKHEHENNIRELERENQYLLTYQKQLKNQFVEEATKILKTYGNHPKP